MLFRSEIAMESIHLGLVVCQKVLETDKTNVLHRISKTNAGIWATMGRSLSYKSNYSLEVSLEIMKTIVVPRLLSGLQALTIKGENFEKLDRFYSCFMRRI